jgi:glycosyltransferase involved in cell wall biosynthesis
MSATDFLLPLGIDDPARPSGGNHYDRRVIAELGKASWLVREHGIAASGPAAGFQSAAHVAQVLLKIPDRSVVLVDGLLAWGSAQVLLAEAQRLHLVVVMHMPFGDRPRENPVEIVRAQEKAALSAASAIIATSSWTKRRLIELYDLPSRKIRIALPGVDPATPVPSRAAGQRLICVAAVTAEKGHDVLIDALSTLSDLQWNCQCVGSLDVDPVFAAGLRDRVEARELSGRLQLLGTRTDTALDRSYADADLLVLASRAETYGMVVTEALTRGLPVIVTNVGGLPEAVGRDADGTRPGLLVPVDDAQALGRALRRWLADGVLRDRLRGAAQGRRQSLDGWATTASAVADVLHKVSQ